MKGSQRSKSRVWLLVVVGVIAAANAVIWEVFNPGGMAGPRIVLGVLFACLATAFFTLALIGHRGTRRDP